MNFSFTFVLEKSFLLHFVQPASHDPTGFHLWRVEDSGFKLTTPRKKQGQHPLTEQRAANFRLLANQ